MGNELKPYKGRDAEAVISQALQMYEEEGLEITQIAPKLNVPARTIHRWLATNATDRWKELQQARALSDYETARTARDTASETLGRLQASLDEEGITDGAERNWRLAHAREVLRAADTQLDHQKWLLERLLSKLYGNKPEQGLSGSGISIIINTSRSVIDAEQQERTALDGDLPTS